MGKVNDKVVGRHSYKQESAAASFRAEVWRSHGGSRAESWEERREKEKHITHELEAHAKDLRFYSKSNNHHWEIIKEIYIS